MCPLSIYRKPLGIDTPNTTRWRWPACRQVKLLEPGETDVVARYLCIKMKLVVPSTKTQVYLCNFLCETKYQVFEVLVFKMHRTEDAGRESPGKHICQGKVKRVREEDEPTQAKAKAPRVAVDIPNTSKEYYLFHTVYSFCTENWSRPV